MLHPNQILHSSKFHNWKTNFANKQKMFLLKLLFSKGVRCVVRDKTEPPKCHTLKLSWSHLKIIECCSDVYFVCVYHICFRVLCADSGWLNLEKSHGTSPSTSCTGTFMKKNLKALQIWVWLWLEAGQIKTLPLISLLTTLKPLDQDATGGDNRHHRDRSLSQIPPVRVDLPHLLGHAHLNHDHQRMPP